MKNELKALQAKLFTESDVFTCNGNKNILMVQNTVSGRLINTAKIIDEFKDLFKLNQSDNVPDYIRLVRPAINEIYLCLDKKTIMEIEKDTVQKCFDLLDEYCREENTYPVSGGIIRSSIISFLCKLYVQNVMDVIETVGLNVDVGYYHRIKPRSASLAYDILEELYFIPESVAISAIGLKKMRAGDFEVYPDGRFSLNDSGQKRITELWQKKMKERLPHPYIKQEITYDLLPVIQVDLLVKYICGEIKEYPNFVLEKNE